MNGRSEALKASSESLTYELHASSFSLSNYFGVPNKSSLMGRPLSLSLLQ